MRVLKMVINHSWCSVLITLLAVLGIIFDWGIWIIAPVLGFILAVGLFAAVKNARNRGLKLLFLRLWHLSGYFSRRFMGNSITSIFDIIYYLDTVDNHRVREWARASDSSQRIFNSWCQSFLTRLENDISDSKFDFHRYSNYLNELWLINNHYFETVKQFCEVVDKVGISPETREQYNRFTVEYNAFVQDFRNNISELRNMAETVIEPPSVKFAQELVVE
ncbi:MAG: hypothetical protein PHQ86_05900 [Dehalococcoidales bacterium]|nr:hypothetical protein [Dehalococcoidales bacterium]